VWFNERLFHGDVLLYLYYRFLDLFWPCFDVLWTFRKVCQCKRIEEGTAEKSRMRENRTYDSVRGIASLFGTLSLYSTFSSDGAP
jgi:hypothetical protein